MKRTIVTLFIATALAFLSSMPLYAVTRTASVDGLWSATATWGGSAAPTAAQDAVINANIDVICDSSTCVALSLSVSGTLTMQEGKALTIGNNGSAAGEGNITIASGGAIYGYASNVLTINVSRSAAGSIGILTNGGTFVWQGRRVTTGTITAVGALTDIGATRGVLLTDSSLFQSAVDAFDTSGYYLVPTSGYFRHHVFELTTGGVTTSDIMVDMDSRGALDSRNTANRTNPTAWAPGDWGAVYSTDTIFISGTPLRTITFGTAFADNATLTNYALGSRIACNADIGGAGDTSFTRICSVSGTNTATLCSDYPDSAAANCVAGFAAYRMYTDNQPPRAFVVNESFKVGDTYEIWQPAQITIPGANKSDANSNNQYNMVFSDGSSTRLQYTLIDYCGQDVAAGASNGPSCIVANQIDNSLTTENLTMTDFDLWHFSGEAGIYLNDPKNMTITRFAIHDAVPAGHVDGHESHGMYVQDGSNSQRTTSVEISHGRIKGTTDGGIIIQNNNASDPDGVACSGCSVHDMFVGMMPSSAGSSVGGIEPISVMNSSSQIYNNLVTNVQGNLIWSAPNFVNGTTEPTGKHSLAVHHNLLMNSQQSVGLYMGNVGSSNGLASANTPSAATSNVVIGAFGGMSRGYAYGNYFNLLNSPSSSTLGALYFVQGAYGNVVIGAPSTEGNVADSFYIAPTTSYQQGLLPTTVTLRDTSAISSATQASSGNHWLFGLLDSRLLSGPNFALDHASGDCRHSNNGGNFTFGVNTRPPIGGRIDVTNSVFTDCYDTIAESAAGAGGDTYAAYTLITQYTFALDGATDSGNNLTNGLLGFTDRYLGNLGAVKGSTAWSSLGSDGTARGVRVAGPPSFAWIPRLYPFALNTLDSQGSAIPPLTNVNILSDVDTDGDGVWNTHDNCDLTFNPSQYDGDSDGKGCACDASGDTCP